MKSRCNLRSKQRAFERTTDTTWFYGGGNTGDTLVKAINNFGTENNNGF